MTFLHESLHTWTGTYAYAGTAAAEARTDPFDDPIKDTSNPAFSSSATGETVDIVNSFRAQLGWANIDSYFSTNNKDASGNITSTMLPFGGKNVTATPMSNITKQQRRIKANIYYMNQRVKKHTRTLINNK